MKKFFAIFLTLIFFFSLSACDKQEIVLDKIDKEFTVQTSNQEKFITDSLENIQLYTTGENGDQPNALKVSWKWEGKEKPDSYVVKLSESKDFEECLLERTTRTYAKIYNLKLGTKYYGLVSAWVGTEEISKSETFEIQTKDGIGRFIKCDGVSNIRDMGTWKTEDGKTVKQGMIYRCGKLNTNGKSERLITDDGLSTMKHLGIKCEIDLRGDSGITSSYIEGASYHVIPIKGSADAAVSTMYSKNQSELCELFTLLSDSNNYPMIIHCAGGADRTGFVAYTLNGLLGVSNEDLCRDYLLTNFAVKTPRKLEFIEPDYISGYASNSGDTLSQKIENHLTECGVKQEEIESFKKLMLK